ncbi:hypothetical protein [Acuticoccus sediminis]|uniref:hypothetical protein n=1 Tax=Acuticoccus sediminis TaxID=2184697 RepID=UPI001CFE38D9|nr:hypothetical protein [Acuticoccus sediminis]
MKQFLLAAALAAATVGAVHAQPAETAPEGGPMHLEFIQQAGSMTFDGSTLTLTNPAHSTIVSAKGADGSTGIMTTEAFVEAFATIAGEDSKDPPNAMVVVGGADTEPAIVELSAPKMNGDAVVYKVAVLEGDLPASGDNVTVFIDPWIHVGPYRPWRAPVVVAPGPWGPRCHWSPYYYGRVCRW